ncbi:Uncharacterized membrane protein [Mucilaginibacter pineti]|uniref:Uncharacterized membrane protein n=1 Tax=Mucilaginibacter pineti TaxID=1391627 RepID=A0A1G7NNP4_9SPHI|nr:Uncharacterized membrane protein [Mucilaginibacter pineti]
MKKKTKDTPTELRSSLDFTKTWTDHVTVFLIDTLGSMRFLICCALFFCLWILWNIHFVSFLKPFDPFPFPILEMSVSIFAIILSVSVLINQNRQSRIETIRSQVEFEVNVRAEEEVTRILAMVHEIHQHLGLRSVHDEQIDEMKESTDLKKIQRTVGRQEEK